MTSCLKREIGKLWNDLTKPPYRELFNPSVSGLFVWRCVQAQRQIDRSLDLYYKRGGSAPYSVVTHANRMISLIVFEALPVKRFGDPSFDAASAVAPDAINLLVDRSIPVLSTLLAKHYSNAIIPTLFKNLKKCEHLIGEARKADQIV